MRTSTAAAPLREAVFSGLRVISGSASTAGVATPGHLVAGDHGLRLDVSSITRGMSAFVDTHEPCPVSPLVGLTLTELGTLAQAVDRTVEADPNADVTFDLTDGRATLIDRDGVTRWSGGDELPCRLWWQADDRPITTAGTWEGSAAVVSLATMVRGRDVRLQASRAGLEVDEDLIMGGTKETSAPVDVFGDTLVKAVGDYGPISIHWPATGGYLEVRRGHNRFRIPDRHTKR